jgi:hypothetical protein
MVENQSPAPEDLKQAQLLIDFINNSEYLLSVRSDRYGIEPNIAGYSDQACREWLNTVKWVNHMADGVTEIFDGYRSIEEMLPQIEGHARSEFQVRYQSFADRDVTDLDDWIHDVRLLIADIEASPYLHRGFEHQKIEEEEDVPKLSQGVADAEKYTEPFIGPKDLDFGAVANVVPKLEAVPQPLERPKLEEGTDSDDDTVVWERPTPADPHPPPQDPPREESEPFNMLPIFILSLLCAVTTVYLVS